MEAINGYLNLSFYGNTVKAYIVAAGVFLGLLLLLSILKKFFIYRFKKLAEKTDNQWDDYLVNTLKATRFWFLLFFSLYVGSRFLQLPDKINHYGYLITVTLFLVQVGLWGSGFITGYKDRYREKHLESDAATVTTVAVLSFVAKLALYATVLLLILENAGVDVTAMIAGLGIGGVAIALASQNILGDLFASLAIAMDKPFAIGDFLVFGDLLGSVEKIGMKTTRLRSLGGEQIILPNSDIMNSRIRNYKRMQERRIVFSVGVIYQTPSEKLKKITEMLRQVIENQEITRFDRAHFKAFGDFSLNFEIVYYVLSPDFNEYMDIQQKINLEIFEQFEKEGIEFAYPTQTLFMEPPEGSEKQTA